MAVMFSGQRPGEELNGLERLHDAFMEADADDVVVVALVRRSKRTINDEKGEAYPTVRFARVEPVTDNDHAAALAMLDRAYKARTGNEALELPGFDDEQVD
ncbi:hypothetical protein [Microbacterium sp. NPDC058389]|uniref:hypothetical protein n=1 Tax=Microbacterium sp. NPDC058389 TaxID=3346475 RepID=UPI0036612E00